MPEILKSIDIPSSLHITLQKSETPGSFKEPGVFMSTVS